LPVKSLKGFEWTVGSAVRSGDGREQDPFCGISVATQCFVCDPIEEMVSDSADIWSKRCRKSARDDKRRRFANRENVKSWKQFRFLEIITGYAWAGMMSEKKAEGNDDREILY